ASLRHSGQKSQGETYCGQVIELNEPLVIVHALVGNGDRTANGMTRIVDENVDAAVPRIDIGDQTIAGRGVGEVTFVSVDVPTAVLDFLLCNRELIAGATDDDQVRTGATELECGGVPDTGRAAGN